jgi:hypothetical protein
MFSISDIPPGDYSLTLWRDSWNIDEVKDNEGRIESYKWGPDIIKKQQIHIEAGKSWQIQFSIP